jgi:hypothetical protein
MSYIERPPTSPTNHPPPPPTWPSDPYQNSPPPTPYTASVFNLQSDLQYNFS